MLPQHVDGVGQFLEPQIGLCGIAGMAVLTVRLQETKHLLVGVRSRGFLCRKRRRQQEDSPEQAPESLANEGNDRPANRLIRTRRAGERFVARSCVIPVRKRTSHELDSVSGVASSWVGRGISKAAEGKEPTLEDRRIVG